LVGGGGDTSVRRKRRRKRRRRCCIGGGGCDGVDDDDGTAQDAAVSNISSFQNATDLLYDLADEPILTPPKHKAPLWLETKTKIDRKKGTPSQNTTDTEIHQVL
jgi:hypothetical protein